MIPSDDPPFRKIQDNGVHVRRFSTARQTLLLEGRPIEALHLSGADLERFQLAPWPGRFMGMTCTVPPSPREQFSVLLSNQPILRGDAVVLLCGEDAEPRLAVATELMRTRAADTIVLSGGIDNPPRWQGADRLCPLLLGQGVSPDRIVIESASQHTWDQAVNVVQLAMDHGWKRLLLVASGYHQARAYLTFLRALQHAEQTETIHLVNVAAGQTPWWEAPAGMTMTRVDLLGQEFEKLGQYHDHVASYDDGLAYLKHWERAR